MNNDDIETFEAMWNMVYADDDDNPEIDFIKTEGITADGRVEEIDLSDLVDDDGTSHYDRYAHYKFSYGIDGKTHEMTFRSSTLDAVAEAQRPYLTYMSER